MSTTTLTTLLVVSGAITAGGASSGEFPAAALPGAHADPHVACFDGVYYIYPTTDGIEGWGSSRFGCWSSRDLATWKDEGVILDLEKDLTWADARAWAPCIARRGDRYFFYFSADQQIGVAVSDRPTGPFRDPLGKPLVPRGAYACQVIDPMVFIDGDGSAYLYFGQGNCNVVKLNEDMISFDPDGVRRITPAGYNEGAFVLERGSTYYLMWSSYDTRDPRYSVSYATGPSPLGPFTASATGPILSRKGIVKGAGHHSVVRIPGTDEWVIAYHRFRIPGGNGYNREVCLSPLRFATDGTIRTVDVFERVTPSGPRTRAPKASPTRKLVAYLMAYFGPEQKLFYAISRDARHWKALNGGKPVWSPPFVRDPYIARARGSSHLVHTTGWSGTTIGHWESSDLIHWTGGAIEVVEESKERCWAPEFYYSEPDDLFYVHWASVHEGHNAIHYLKTRDWKGITPADSAVWYDIGIHDIDLTIVRHRGTYYGFHKPGGVEDRMGNRLSVSTSLDPSRDSFARSGHGKVVFEGQIQPTEGPEVIRLIGEERWYVYGDPFRSELQAWETRDFASFRRIDVSTPRGAKHCSMLALTQEELDALLERYPIVEAEEEPGEGTTRS